MPDHLDYPVSPTERISAIDAMTRAANNVQDEHLRRRIEKYIEESCRQLALLQMIVATVTMEATTDA